MTSLPDLELVAAHVGALTPEQLRGWGSVVAIVGAGLALAAWLVDRRRRTYTDLATTPAAALFAGRNELKGRAWVPEPLVSFRTKTQSVWWSYELEEERRHTRTVTTRDSNGNTSTRTETYYQFHTIDTKSDRVGSIDVVDSTGPARVHLPNAKIVPRRALRDEFKDDGRLGERGFLKKMFDNRTGKYRETEDVIAVGDVLFVTGEAVLDERRGVPELRAELVSTRSEESHTGNLGSAVLALVLLSFAALAWGLANLVSPTGLTGLSAAVAFGVPTLLLLLALLGTTYNRLKLMDESLDRAWSLIDVQLQRRHDLIPHLANVVRAHATHERELFETIAAGRLAAGKHDADALKTAAVNQTVALREIVARAEAQPGRTADESYLKLQRELADTETRIAGSRTFYNDTLTILRNQAGSFPQLLVARFLHVGRHEHLAADGFERTVPTIEPAFT